MGQNKLYTTLGLARRAGRLNWGFDMVAGALQQTALVLVSEQLSDRSKAAIKNQCARTGTPVQELAVGLEALGEAIGTKPVGIIGIKDEGFAKLVQAAIQNNKSIGGHTL